MKNWLIFSCLLVISCRNDSPYKIYPQTYYSKSSTSDLEKAEKDMIKELYFFYTNSDKKLSFCEVNLGNRLLVNYNPTNKTLFTSNDFCSGWSVFFGNVEEKDVKFLSDSMIKFSDYKKYLTPPPLKSVDYNNLQTNAPCLGKNK